MTIVDSHQHLWDIGRFPYAWCRDIPILNRRFDLEDYRDATEGLGIGQTVFVESDVDEPYAMDEVSFIQQLVDQNPRLAGIIAAVRPERSDFQQQLERLQPFPKVRGVRRVLHTVADSCSQSTLFAENLRRLATHGWSFDLCVLARQLPLAIALVEKCPEVSFVLDHCGGPDVRGKTFDPWRDHIEQIARFPNVSCKISGLIASADPETATPAGLQPWIAHTIEHFGWDRVLWGSDWPVCTLTAPLARWLELAKTSVAQAPPEAQEKLFSHNARKIYRLEPDNT